MATFGSIYVPPTTRTYKVNITHYLYEMDIALICNKKDMNKILSYLPKHKHKHNQVLPNPETINMTVNSDYENIRFFRYVEDKNKEKSDNKDRQIESISNGLSYRRANYIKLQDKFKIHNSYNTLLSVFLKRAFDKIKIPRQNASQNAGKKIQKQTKRGDKKARTSLAIQ